MGSAYGAVLQDAFPAIIGEPTTYAVVGMGALFGAAAHAPLTAIVIVYEVTGDIRIVVPLAIACLVSTVLARQIGEGNIYTMEAAVSGMSE